MNRQSLYRNAFSAVMDQPTNDTWRSDPGDSRVAVVREYRSSFCFAGTSISAHFALLINSCLTRKRRIGQCIQLVSARQETDIRAVTALAW